MAKKFFRVAKLDGTGEVIKIYANAYEAALECHLSPYTISRRCTGKTKRMCVDGYDYAWADKTESLKKARTRIGNNTNTA